MRGRRTVVVAAALVAVPAALSVAAGLADPKGTARVLLQRVRASARSIA